MVAGGWNGRRALRSTEILYPGRSRWNGVSQITNLVPLIVRYDPRLIIYQIPETEYGGQLFIMSSICSVRISYFNQLQSDIQYNIRRVAKQWDGVPESDRKVRSEGEDVGECWKNE